MGDEARGDGFMKVNVSVVLLDEQDRVLMLQRSRTEDFLPGVWELPGGGLKEGEHPKEAARREVVEETGIDSEIFFPIDCFCYWTKGEYTVEIVFLGRAEKTTEIRLSSEHVDWQWVDETSVRRLNCTPEIQAVLERTWANWMKRLRGRTVLGY